jgi:ABC-type multidrug transport system ATPase subunit
MRKSGNGPLLELIGVSKKIGKTTIVQPFDLTAGSGEVIALCGGNGAGKSTILRMVAGILTPTTGTIRAAGVERRANPRVYAEQIGYMPDDFSFGGALTVRETLSFYARLRGVPRQRVDELLDWVGLAEAGKQKVSVLSKGMRQRLLFAQALLADPPLLVLDEPTNGLDPYWMDEFSEMVLHCRSMGTTVLFSTHQMQVAEWVADRALFLDRGLLAGQGTVAEWVEQYGNGGLSQVFHQLVATQRERRP